MDLSMQLSLGLCDFFRNLQAENDSAMTHGEKGESDSTGTDMKRYT